MKLISGGSWVFEVKCRECGEIVDFVVQLGEEPDDESLTTEVCEDCLENALKLATAKRRQLEEILDAPAWYIPELKELLAAQPPWEE